MSDVESDSTFVAMHADKSPSQNKAKFYPFWKRNKYRSEQEGKEIGEYIDHVIILCPGQMEAYNGVATDEHKRLYREQWEQYKAGKEQRIKGTPIEALGLDKSRSDTWKSINVYTVEQLADLSDAGKQKMGMGADDDVKKAQNFLKRETPESRELKEQNTQLKAQNAELMESLKKMQEQIDMLAANQKRKPGRKPKEAQPSVN